MRLLIINPNSDPETNKRIEQKLLRIFGETLSFDCVCIAEAPKIVSSKEGEAASMTTMINLIKQGENQYDGFIIACHADPNLDIMREITEKPVVGIAEASYRIAQMMGNYFSIICPSEKSISRKYEQTHRYNCNSAMKKVVVAPKDSQDDLIKAAQAAAEPGIDAIVLGCANYTPYDKILEQHVKIPVIDGVVCATFIAAGLAAYQKYKKQDV